MRSALIAVLVLVAVAGFAAAQEDLDGGGRGDQLVGLRFGLYHNTGDRGAAPDSSPSPVRSNISENAVTMEFFYNYYVLDWLAFEGILGTISRGDVEFSDDLGNRAFGSASMYPIQVGLKLAPLSGHVSDNYRPYIHGGGALFVVREIYEGGYLASPYDDYYTFATRSKTKFGWWLGGGFESYVSQTICLTSDIKYESISYSDIIAGFRDHSGYQITVGVAYIFRHK
jgi:hypothetical protein